MNRDEILAMTPGREMDALVAENVFGWRECRVNGNHWAYGKPPDFDHPDDPRVRIEDYSTDLSAVWEVVAELSEKRGYGFSLGRAGIRYEPDRMWNVRVGTDEWVEANTAPEAICKAALLAVCSEAAIEPTESPSEAAADKEVIP